MISIVHKRGKSQVFILLTVLIFFCLMMLPSQGAAQNPAPEQYGKYVNSMLVKTRTAATYPAGLKVFTLVGVYQDADEYRNPATNDMEKLPGGVHRRQLTSVLWGEIGITADFQAGVSIPYIYRDYENPALDINTTETGIGDARLYAKYRLIFESRYVPGIALDGFIKLPTGDEGDHLGNGETDVTIGLSLSKRFSNISFHINPEFTSTGGEKSDLGPPADNRTNLNAGIMFHATDRLVPMLEVNSLWWGDVGDQTDIGGGVLWFPTKNTSVKVAMSRNVNVDMPWSADWMPWMKLAVWF